MSITGTWDEDQRGPISQAASASVDPSATRPRDQYETSIADPSTGLPMRMTAYGTPSVIGAFADTINSSIASGGGSRNQESTVAAQPSSSGAPYGTTDRGLGERGYQGAAPNGFGPVSAAAGLPDGVSHLDVSPQGPVSQAGGMTTEEANQYYGAINAQNRANDRANHEAAQTSMLRASQANADSYRAELAKNAARVDRSSIARNASNIGQSSSDAQRAEAQAEASRSAYINGPVTNYAQQAGGVQSAGQDAQKFLTANRAAKQQLASGAIDLQEKQAKVDAINALKTAKTPQERAEAESAVLALHGKSDPGWRAIHMAGEKVPDPNNPGQYVSRGDNVLIFHERTGEKHLIGGEQASRPDGNSAPKFVEGQKYRDASGVERVYKNGQWVNP